MTDDALAAAMAQQRRQLRLHCYRLLGSSHDAEDMVQETFVRVLRSRAGLTDPGAARAWLHRIATNVCLDELARRPRRARPMELAPPADPALPPAPARPEEEWLEPMPSAWLDPDAAYAEKESVALAFVAALQTLTPPQRAVLLLRDVVGLSAEETAEALTCTVSAANSTLHRARLALAERVGPHRPLRPERVDRALLERYLKTWTSGDFAAMVALLHEEATLAMPPSPTWLSGRAAVVRFFEGRVRALMEARTFLPRVVEANGGPAVAFDRRGAGGSGAAALYAIHLIEERDGRVSAIDHFTGHKALRAFQAEGTCLAQGASG